MGILVLAIVIANVFFKSSSTVSNQQDNAAMMGPMMYGTTEVKNEVVETEKGIVYNGKVIPVETYYYTKKAILLKLGQLYSTIK